MIFTLFDFDVEQAKNGILDFGESINFLGKSLSSIKDDFAGNGFSGFVNGLKTLFVSQSKRDASLHLETDIKALSEYVDAVQNGTNAGKAFDDTMKNASTTAINYARSTDASKVSVQEFTAMQKAATLSTIGLKAATVALNMAISMGIGVAINFAISALDDYIHRHERLIEAAEKEASEYNSLSSELKSLDDQMESNSDRIKELQSLGTLTFVEQEELDNLQEANEKLETQLNLKNALANIEYGEARDAAIKVIDDKSEVVQEFDSNGLYIGSYDATRSEKIKANVSDLDHIDSEIQRYLSEYAEALKANFIGDFEFSTKEDYEEQIANLREGRQLVLDETLRLQAALQEQADVLIGDDDDSRKYRNEVKQSSLLVDDYLGNGATQKTNDFNSVFDNNQFVKEKEQLEDLARQGKLTADVFDNTNAYDSLVDALEVLGISIEDIVNQFNALAESEAGAQESFDPDKFESLNSEFGNQISNVDALYNGYQTLTAAMDEYNTYGYMTAETLSSLASSGMIQYLEATANGISINTDALLQNAEAAKVSAINALQNSVAQQLVALAAGDVAIAAPGAGDAIVAAGEMAAASAAGFKTASAAAAETTIFLEGVRDAQAGNAVDPDAYRDRADQLIANAQAVANSIAKIDIASAGYQKAMAGNAKSTGSAKSAADEYVESLKKEKEALQDVKNELDDQKDAYDSVIRAVQKALDKEIEALEKQKDALSDPDIEGSYGNRINFIQMEIDALNDLRDAKEREIAVEKAKAELERLKDQKTLRVYMEGEGFVWRTDESAIRDAQEALDKAELDKQISDLEDAKEKLEDMLEQEEEALDKNIEKLQEYKDKWGEIADAYQDEQDRLMAAQVLGQNWEAEILNGRIETLTSFRDKYISIMAEIAAKVEEIEALERRIKEAQNSIGSSSGNSGGGGSGATNASLPRYRVVNTRYGTVSRSGFTTQSAAQEYIKTLGASQGFFRIEKYANGTMFSPTTLAYVDDGIGRNAGSELIVRAPKHGRLTSLELGSGVIPAQATKNLIAMAKSPQAMLQEQFKNLFNNQMLAANTVGTNKIFEFKFGDIIMHGVNDTTSFAKILTREFPAILKQELGR